MAKRKQRRSVTVVRNVAVPAVASVTRSGPSPRRRGGGSGAKSALAAVAGGAVGSLTGGLLVRAGVSPTTAAVGVAAVGTLGAFALNGPAKAASIGAAAAGAGQLALGWLAGRASEQEAEAAKEEEKKPAEPKKRQGLLPDPRVTFEEQRRRELAEALDGDLDEETA